MRLLHVGKAGFDARESTAVLTGVLSFVSTSLHMSIAQVCP